MTAALGPAVLGSAGYWLGLLASAFGVVILALGLARRDGALLRLGGALAGVLALAGLLMTSAMQWALLTDDFSISFVHDNSATTTPLPFKIATMWSALEGSIILWALILTIYTALVGYRFRRRLTDPLVAWALLTLFVVAGFFFVLLAGPANPFSVVAVPAGYDGPGPNPLLQNHILMAIHPPMLYLGYVGFSVPFAFAVGALVTGRLGEGWLIETRRWTLFAWGFLTLGIMLGAWWSYEVLGWGGYWAWDPVENASLLPWLTGTAYLHSVVVQERRGMLRFWNLSLLCATFALTILGTFLTRSGVVASVHAFSDSPIGPMLLAFFTAIVTVSIALIGWRGQELCSAGRIDSAMSRDASFLANNVLLAVFAFVVLLGTTFPLVVEALGDERLSVGEPYFDRMTMPLGLALLALMAVAPVLPWRRSSIERLADRLFWPAVIGVGVGVGAVLLGARGIVPVLAFVLAGFAGGSAARMLVLAVRRDGARGLVGRRNGGMIVHLGVVLIALGFAASQAYVRQAEFVLAEGERVSFSGHDLVYLGTAVRREDNRILIEASVELDGGEVLKPSVRNFVGGGQPIGTPSVRATALQDVYLVLDKPPESEGSEATIRVVIQPLVSWLWIGTAVMAVGTMLAAVGRDRRALTRPVVTAEREVADVVSLDTPQIELDGAAPDQPRRLWVLVVSIAVAAVLGVFVIVLATSSPPEQPGSPDRLIGQTAPPVEGLTITGDSYSLEEHRGEFVVVNFFATWCVPCQIEHPELVEFSERHAESGDASVVSVAFQDDPELIEEYFAREGGDWPVLPADTGRVILDYGVTGVPESYIVAPDGTVIASFISGVRADDLDAVIEASKDDQAP